MTSLDDRILEFLHENKPSTPTKMTTQASLPYSRQHVDRRSKKLAEKGLVESLGNGVYMITDDGKAYLEGRLNTENWRYIDENADEVVNDDNAGTSPSEGSN